MSESTLAIIKPDAVLGRYVADIVKMIEVTGLVVRWAVTDQPPSNWWCIFYDEHRGRPFFTELVDFMCSGPSVFMRLEGPNAIRRWRELMGATDPQKADPSSIRGRYGDSGPRNAVHGSDSPKSADRELRLVTNKVDLYPSSPLTLRDTTPRTEFWFGVCNGPHDVPCIRTDKGWVAPDGRHIQLDEPRASQDPTFASVTLDTPITIKSWNR